MEPITVRTDTDWSTSHPAHADGTPQGAKVLVVAHDGRLASLVGSELKQAGFHFEPALEAGLALDVARAVGPDLVIAQMSDPAWEGFELIRSLRDQSNVPILTLAADDDASARVDALNSGADDCLPRSFGVAELLARVRALLRGRELAQTGAPRSVLAYADVHLDQDTLDVTRGTRRLTLRRKTFEVLTYFLQRPERVVSRRDLLEHVWSDDFARTFNVVEKTVADLRHELEAPGEPRLIHTIWRFGYMMRTGARGALKED